MSEGLLSMNSGLRLVGANGASRRQERSAQELPTRPLALSLSSSNLCALLMASLLNLGFFRFSRSLPRNPIPQSIELYENNTTVT